MTLRRSAGGLLAGGNATLGEQPAAGKSGASFGAAVTGRYRRAHVCLCACEPA